MDDMIAIADAAQTLGVNPSTVIKWAESGRLLGGAKGDRGRWFVPRSEVVRLAEQRDEAKRRSTPSRWKPMSERSQPYDFLTPAGEDATRDR